MRTSGQNRRIHQLLTAIGDGRLNPRPDFQRRQVWTNDDKVAFINTVLGGLPFPEIYICAGSLDPDTGEATEFLVDGQQRVTTLYQYFTGYAGIRLGSLPAYGALDREEKEKFLEYEVVVRDLGKQPIEQIRVIFERINSANYALNAIEIQNARYGGAFKQFCERVADDELFKKWRTFTPGDVRRMQDLRFSLLLVSTILSTYFNRDDGIEEFLERYNDEFPPSEKLAHEIGETLRFVDALQFEKGARAYRKTDLFSLLVECHRAMFIRRVSINIDEASARLKNFYHDLETYQFATGSPVFSYYMASQRSSTDRLNRYRRGEHIQHLLDQSYEVTGISGFYDQDDAADATQLGLDLEQDEP